MYVENNNREKVELVFLDSPMHNKVKENINTEIH